MMKLKKEKGIGICIFPPTGKVCIIEPTFEEALERVSGTSMLACTLEGAIKSGYEKKIDEWLKENSTCKGCKEEIVGFPTAGYCENCLCTECGDTLETENERAVQICEYCESEIDD